MNSEELEVSLRTEFENYLKNTLAEIRQEISQLQETVNSELERHKSQLDEVFENANSKFEKDLELEPSFKESVMEHLRLSRDEGAQITAMAIARAEEMEQKTSAQNAGSKEIFEAVSEISSKTTQSDILKTLVHHATHFAPRGAFFIIKNEHLVGWRVFGKEKGSAEEKVREVFLPLASNSILSESVKNLATSGNESGGFADDLEIFQKLEFGTPDKMVAIPLVARGRGVAVLYADYGNEGGTVNVDALETLVKVAGLTVEVLASSKNAGSKRPASRRFDEDEPVAAEGNNEAVFVSNAPSYQNFVAEPHVEPASPVLFEQDSYSAPIALPTEPITPPVSDYVSPESHIEDVPKPQFESTYSSYETASWSSNTPVADEPASSDFVEYNVQTEPVQKIETDYLDNEYSPSPEPLVEPDYSVSNFSPSIPEPQIETEYPTFETSTWSSPVEDTTPSFSAHEFAENFAKETDPAEYAKDVSYQVETNEAPNYQEPVGAINAQATEVGDFAPTKEQTFGSYEFDSGKASAETTVPVTAPKSRLSERNVDLPIEVGEDERRLHNDARRFARLLVSEIKLYNEQKVKEGRDASDLYERLKEAIDRSREMYDKRVQPPVASKFDYFHYELVNTLAEGDDNKLGTGYPGSSV